MLILEVSCLPWNIDDAVSGFATISCGTWSFGYCAFCPVCEASCKQLGVSFFFKKKQICYISKRVPVILKGKSATRPKFESYQKKNPKKPYILFTSLAKGFAPAKIPVCGLISNPRGNYHGEFLKMIKKNISVHNDELLLKHLDNFYRKDNIQWSSWSGEKYYVDVVPHLAKEKGSLWWKDILGFNVIHRRIAICHPAKGAQLAYGMICFLELSIPSHIQTFWVLQRTPLSPCTSFDRPLICLDVSTFPCPELPTMNSSPYKMNLLIFLILILMTRIHGLSFGAQTFTLQVIFISFSLESSIQRKPSFGSEIATVSLKSIFLLGCSLMTD